VTAFERVPGNAICTPAEQADRGYIPLSDDTARACEAVITGPGHRAPTAGNALIRHEDASGAHSLCDEEITRLRGSLDAAEAKLASYDSAISWATSCTACARVLDASIADHDRAGQAEAKLAAIADHCRKHAEHVNLYCPDLGRPASALVYADHILAIIDGEADPRG